MPSFVDIVIAVCVIMLASCFFSGLAFRCLPWVPYYSFSDNITKNCIYGLLKANKFIDIFAGNNLMHFRKSQQNFSTSCWLRALSLYSRHFYRSNWRKMSPQVLNTL